MRDAKRRDAMVRDLASGERVEFRTPDHDPAGPPAFSLQVVHGAYVVRGPLGDHAGSFANFDAAWAHALKVGRRPPRRPT